MNDNTPDEDLVAGWTSFTVSRGLLNLAQCVQAINDSSKDCVFPIQGGLCGEGHKELGAIGVWTLVRHAHNSPGIVS
jgi:hypothetical protein